MCSPKTSATQFNSRFFQILSVNSTLLEILKKPQNQTNQPTNKNPNQTKKHTNEQTTTRNPPNPKHERILIGGVSKSEYRHWKTLRNFGQISKADEDLVLSLSLKLNVDRPRNSTNSKLWRMDLDQRSTIPINLKGE